MLISYTKSFIHIHIYRVAGTSIRQALNKYQYPPYECYYYHLLKRMRLLPSDKSFPGHITANSLQKKLPRRYFNNFFKFAFMRNPWDWQVSLYHYALQNPDHFQHQRIKKFRNFEEYLYWRVKKDKRLQKDFVTDDKDNIIVDYVGKFENLQDDFQYVCRQIGIEESLPRKNPSDHRHYHQYYNEETKELIAQHFKKDIELFNYKY